METDPRVSVQNKSFRYGDGFFETMKWHEGKLVFEDAHFARFYNTADALGCEIPALLTRARLLFEIEQLVQKNKCEQLARVRLTAWRGDGGLFEGNDQLHYSIECWPLDDAQQKWNENGLVLGVFEQARKSNDRFAQFKTSSFQCYSLAAREARRQKWNDALVLNNHGRIADSCIANIFIFKKGKLITPPLSEGPVAGVFRQHLINTLEIQEAPIGIDDLETADEIFLTNAIRGIRWVRQLGERIYSSENTRHIYNQVLQTI